MGLQEDKPERPGLQGPAEAYPLSRGTPDLLGLCSRGGCTGGPAISPGLRSWGEGGLHPRRRELTFPWAREAAHQSWLREAWLPPRGRPPKQPCLGPICSPACPSPAPPVPGCGPARVQSQAFPGCTAASRWPAGDPMGPGGRMWGHGPRLVWWASGRQCGQLCLPLPQPWETRAGTGAWPNRRPPGKRADLQPSPSTARADCSLHLATWPRMDKGPSAQAEEKQPCCGPT